MSKKSQNKAYSIYIIYTGSLTDNPYLPYDKINIGIVAITISILMWLEYSNYSCTS